MIAATRLFLDGGDPVETQTIQELLGGVGKPGLDGQTTNPSLIAKNLARGKGLAEGKKLTAVEADVEYRRIVTEIAKTVSGPISIQVIANENTSKEDMLTSGRSRLRWIPNAVIKFPCIPNGIAAAHEFCQEGPVNMTLVFSQAQAAAVYSATDGAKFPVFVSPFIGRLDDRGENGMDLIANILKMYEPGDGHVSLLSASVRTFDHFQQAIALKSPVMTVPASLITQWKEKGFSLPDSLYVYPVGALKAIPYDVVALDKPFDTYDIRHPLTDAGLAKFWSDWHQWVE